MALPSDFQFSQASLQDYVDCPRRFQLRYVLQLAWPAQEAEPVLEHERHMRQGAAFHRLVHRHVLGMDEEKLTRTVQEPDLRRWWHNYLAHPLAGLPENRYPEFTLSAPLGAPSIDGHRLLAKYDLVAVAPGERAVIVDWKTSRKRPKRQYLVERLQTRVYPCLLVQAGAHLGGQLIVPEQVEMVYWFADHPGEPAHFPYDTNQWEADEAYLIALIEEIAGREDAAFPLTSEVRRCGFCSYRSLCQRGVKPGNIDEWEDEADVGDALDFDLDFDQIAEIAF
jgi:CRISPR/Cas system-associated exonuclease Cas4 (RecB family)